MRAIVIGRCLWAALAQIIEKRMENSCVVNVARPHSACDVHELGDLFFVTVFHSTYYRLRTLNDSSHSRRWAEGKA